MHIASWKYMNIRNFFISVQWNELLPLFSESRYLLLLTENYGALTILQQKIFTMDNAVVIFGSSFPSDQEYTQVIVWHVTHFIYMYIQNKITKTRL
jgi:hypothetical protein